MFFNSIFNPGAGSPSAFTSPGMDPQVLRTMLSMNGGVGGQGPGVANNAPVMPSPIQSNGMGPRPMPQQIPGQQGQQGFSQLLDPQRLMQLRQLLMQFRGGAPGMQPSTQSIAPGPVAPVS